MLGLLRHGGAGLATLVAVTLGSRAPAAAQAQAAVAYQGPPDCPDRAAFLAEVARRSPAPAASGRLQTARLRVDLSATPDGFEGVLRREDDLGASEPRVLRASRCADLVQGLALTAALSFVAAPEPPATVTAAPTPPPPTETPVGPRARARAFAGLGVLVGGFVAGAPMGGLELSVGVTRVGGGPGPWLALGWDGRLRGLLGRNDVLGADRARFDLYAGAVELCPAHAGLGARARLSLCGTGQAGMLRGRGIDIASPAATSVPWLSAGASAAVRLLVAGRWQVLAAAEVVRPLRQVDFVFLEPRVYVARTPAWVSSGALAVLVHFP